MTLRSSKRGTASPVTGRGAASRSGGRVRAAATSADDRMLERLERESFAYFLSEANPANGLVADSTHPGSPSSIAAVGFALAAYPVGVERGFLTRAGAVSRTLAALRFFRDSPQGTGADDTGCHGFYYHFLEMGTGRRAWRCELSTIDTALLLAGALTAAQYFDLDRADERELREAAAVLYSRADWRWAQNGGDTVTHGWTPERGFLRFRWFGYDEATILYLLGLGSPEYPLPAESYPAWTSTYSWKKLYGREFLYAGPLFIHQYSHIWVDFRGIRDEFMRGRGSDYFENSRRATYTQREYGRRNPLGYAGYDDRCWGFTACEGPGPTTLLVDGVERRFYDYIARGVPFGPDDGTIAPWAAAASLPFAPEIVLPAIRNFIDIGVGKTARYGWEASYNPTFPASSPLGWVSPWNYGINQGPLLLMVENYRSGLIWRLMRGCSYLVAGLRRAGFTGGWLGTALAG